ncbi:SDR family NAD(P)-dependent oxidoreductase [Chloroflexota bacterium]
MDRLKGMVAVVTGAGSGIGREIALLFSREGAVIAAVDCVVEAGEETVKQIRGGGGEAVFIEADVTQASDAERMVRQTIEKFGRLDILSNNAGVLGDIALVGEATEENFDKVMSINVKGVFLCSKYAVLEMLKGGGGSIVNSASMLGLVGMPGNTAYCASKGAVIQFTKTMAAEYAANNIRVNCICAGWIDTPMNEVMEDKVIRWMMRELPIGRMGKAGEVAQAALYLASDDASYVTGAALVVDGGWTAK